MKNKKAQFGSIKWAGSSVSALVVIAGLIIAVFTDQKSTGYFFIGAGLVGALLITLIITLGRHVR